MQKRIFVKPTPGMVVINEQTKIKIPADGQEVVASKYYSRRIAEGGLVLAKKGSGKSSTK